MYPSIECMFSGPLHEKIWLDFKAFFFQMPFGHASLITVQIEQAGLLCLYVFDCTLIKVLNKILKHYECIFIYQKHIYCWLVAQP